MPMIDSDKVKSELQAILDSNRGGCLCTMRESCSECDPYSSGRRVKDALYKYIQKLGEA